MQGTEAGGGESFSLAWDDNGNLTLKDMATDTTFEYNWDNKLRSASVDEQQVLSVKYDPMGNRVLRTANGVTRKYVVDVSGRLPTILLEMNPANGGIMKTYIHANGEILAQHDGPHTWARYFYLHDRLGSVRQVIDTDGWVKNYYIYNPFGELYSGETQEWITNPFKFTGQYYDSEIAEYYLRARQYDPHIARFTSRDRVTNGLKEPAVAAIGVIC
jgi:RHS repeat-associated protein